MSTPDAKLEKSLSTATDDLKLSETPSESPSSSLPHNIAPDASQNPWNSEPHSQTDSPDHEEKRVLRTPDPSSMDPEIVEGLKTELPSKGNVKPEVQQELLSEFDPLAVQDEKDAQSAWQTAESHPPPPQPTQPIPSSESSEAPPPPEKDKHIPPPLHSASSTPNATASSSFPTLSAIARTFSIPMAPQARPASMDAAKHVPSPATLSSFASQQSAPPIRPSESSQESATATVIRNNNSPNPSQGGDVPFDFQKFLDQMKTKSAEPVARYLKSFLSNFAKRTFTVNDQVKIINDFLNFIAGKMRECDVWKNASDVEFDNAMEGIEKLVMNRLYEFTFTPQVVRVTPPRPITADDLERDRILSQRIALFGWIQEEHLDIPEGEGSKGFMMFAQQELMKINHYKAPRDKLICILNSCKVIFGLIRHLKKDEGADSFIPILIFVVLKANPEHLLSNVEFINRFRNPEKLQSEAGYYLSSLMGAVSFIETMDHTSLSNISKEDFERNVENAIQSLPSSEPHSPKLGQTALPITPKRTSSLPSAQSPHAGEESAEPLTLPTPAQSLSEDARRLLQKTGDTMSKPLNAIGRIFSEALDGVEDKLAYLPGPFAPLELGRESRREAEYGRARPPDVPHWTHPNDPNRQFQQQQTWGGSAPPSPGFAPQTPVGGDPAMATIQTPYKPRIRRGPSSPSSSYRLSGAPGSPGYGYGVEDTPSRPSNNAPYTNQPLSMGPSLQLHAPRGALPTRLQSEQYRDQGPTSAHVSRTPTPNLDFVGMQEEIDHAHEQASTASRETLIQIFPTVDLEVVEWVLEANDGDLGKSIEALLEMSSGQ